MTYKAPNHTQVPNLLLDRHMAEMTESELRVMLAVCRKTFGWHKQKDMISLTQLEEITGMSRQGVINGVQKAIGRGLLERFACDQGFEYSLIVEEEVVNEVDQQVVNEVDTQKKLLQKKTTASRDVLTDAVMGKPDPLEGYPEDVRDVLSAFVEVFRRDPAASEKAFWIKTARKWKEIGVKPGDVKRMYAHSREQGLAIKSPESITFAYDELRREPKKEYRRAD